MNAMLSSDRVAMVWTCLGDVCVHAGTAEPLLICSGSCHRQLHGNSCAQLSHGSVQQGDFTCPECRLQVMLPDTEVADFSPEALRMAFRSMLQELSQGQKGTGSGYANLARLEIDWALELGGGTTIPKNVVMPTDEVESLKAFLLWLATDRDRAKSLDTILRVAARTCCVRVARISLR